MSAASAAEGATTASDEVTSSKNKKQGATEAGKTKVFSGAPLIHFHFLFFVQKACKREMTFKCRIHKNSAKLLKLVCDSIFLRHEK